MRKNSFPTTSEELLLQAALLSDQLAIEAWKKWKEREEIDEVGAASQRLLPLVFQNLKKQGINDPLMDKMKGVYRYLFAENHASFHAYRPFFEELNRREIPFMFLNEAAVLLTVYSDFGLRGMQDIDLLIPQERIAEVHQILLQQKIECKFLKFRAVRKITPRLLSVINEITFVNAKHLELDLHWRLMINEEKEITELFWSHCRCVQAYGISFYVPKPEVLFFQICQGGIDYDIEPKFRWIADALLLLRATPDFCWKKVQSYAALYQEEASTNYLMAYLKKKFFLDCPLEKKEQDDTTFFKRIAPKQTKEEKSLIVQFWHWHQSTRPNGSKLLNVLSFPRFLSEFFGLRFRSSLLPYGLYLFIFRLIQKKKLNY